MQNIEIRTLEATRHYLNMVGQVPEKALGLAQHLLETSRLSLQNPLRQSEQSSTQQLRHRSFRNSAGAVVLGLGISIAMLTACSPAQAQQATEVRQVEQTSQPSPTAIVRIAENTPTPFPVKTPTSLPTETLTPKPVDTATAVSTATATSTRAPEASPTPEKPPLPEYGVFKGSLLKKDTQEPVGTIAISYLPGPVEKVFVYYLFNRQGRPFLFTLKPLGNNSFESVEQRYEKIKITVNGPQSISVVFSSGSDMTSALTLTGEGQTALLKVYKEINIKELQLGPYATISDQKIKDQLAEAKIILP